MSHITIHIHGVVPCGYNIDFQATKQNGNDLLNDIERDIVDRMAEGFMRNMEDYEYRYRQMVGLLVQEWDRRAIA